MDRQQEFGLGATCIEKDQEGNESERNAIEIVGGKRDQDTSGLPQDRPAPTRRRAGPLLYPETLDSARQWDDEIRRSRSD